MSGNIHYTHNPVLPEPCAQAALLLVESLMHALVARSVISVADAVEVIDVAFEVERDRQDELGGAPAAVSPTNSLLLAIRESMAIDL